MGAWDRAVTLAKGLGFWIPGLGTNDGQLTGYGLSILVGPSPT